MTDATDPGPIREQAERTMEDQAAAHAEGAARAGGSRLAAWSPELDDPVDEGDRLTNLADTEVSQEARRWQAEGIPSVSIPPIGRARLAARAAVPRAIVNAHREVCPTCMGGGFMPSVNDYLRESIALLGDQGDEVVRAFYVALFRTAPELARLFPGNPTEGDLGTDHKGAQQREKLLQALAALANLYDPDNGDEMVKLDTALKSFGRSHAAFVRPDGTIQGATWEEYAAVKDALFQTLVRAAGEAWKPEYTASWSQAYDYAAAVMLAEQYRSGFAAPRFPRA